MSRPVAFQWSTAARGVEHLDVADHLGHRAEAERGHQLAHLLGDELEEVDDELGLAAEPLRAARGSAWRRRPGRCRGGRRASSRSPTRPAGRWRSRTPRRRAARRSRRRDRSSSGRRSARRCGRAGRSAAASAASRPGRAPTAPPACFSDVSGLAPVPPSWPEISTTSALALLTRRRPPCRRRPRRRASRGRAPPGWRS